MTLDVPLAEDKAHGGDVSIIYSRGHNNVCGKCSSTHKDMPMSWEEVIKLTPKKEMSRKNWELRQISYWDVVVGNHIS